MKLKIKLIDKNAKLPTKAHLTDACFDIYSNTNIKINPKETQLIHTGFKTEIPQGYFAPVFARSGLATKKGLRPSNCVGVIDSDYRGEWLVCLYNDSNEPQIIQCGDRIAQFTLLPVLDIDIEQVETVSDTLRGKGGFGSSGK